VKYAAFEGICEMNVTWDFNYFKHTDHFGDAGIA
jgi:hypothetical protein